MRELAIAETEQVTGGFGSSDEEGDAGGDVINAYGTHLIFGSARPVSLSLLGGDISQPDTEEGTNGESVDGETEDVITVKGVKADHVFYDTDGNVVSFYIEGERYEVEQEGFDACDGMGVVGLVLGTGGAIIALLAAPVSGGGSLVAFAWGVGSLGVGLGMGGAGAACSLMS